MGLGTELCEYISPVSSSIHAKLDRNIRQHRRYPSSIRTQDFVQPTGRSKPNIATMTRISNFVIPQPCTATFATPAHSDNVKEHTTESPASTYRDQGVLCDSDEVFDKYSATHASYADCDTPRFVPSSPARFSSPARRDNTSRTTSPSPTSSYSTRIDPIETNEDIGISSMPSTQATSYDPHCRVLLFPADSVTPVPRNCTASVTVVSSTLSEPAPAV